MVLLVLGAGWSQETAQQENWGGKERHPKGPRLAGKTQGWSMGELQVGQIEAPESCWLGVVTFNLGVMVVPINPPRNVTSITLEPGSQC